MYTTTPTDFLNITISVSYSADVSDHNNYLVNMDLELKDIHL